MGDNANLWGRASRVIFMLLDDFLVSACRDDNASKLSLYKGKEIDS